ncbi:UNVERIFIED_CONTAM: hypothetical protein Sindi_2134300 [Sesamum indicum]
MTQTKSKWVGKNPPRKLETRHEDSCPIRDAKRPDDDAWPNPPYTYGTINTLTHHFLRVIVGDAPDEHSYFHSQDPITRSHEDTSISWRSLWKTEIAEFEMEGSLRRNVYAREEVAELRSPTLHLTKRELHRMMEEESRNVIVDYERRTATPVVKEAARRQLFREEAERTMEVASRRDQEPTRDLGPQRPDPAIEEKLDGNQQYLEQKWIM